VCVRLQRNQPGYTDSVGTVGAIGAIGAHRRVNRRFRDKSDSRVAEPTDGDGDALGRIDPSHHDVSGVAINGANAGKAASTDASGTYTFAGLVAENSSGN